MSWNEFLFCFVPNDLVNCEYDKVLFYSTKNRSLYFCMCEFFSSLDYKKKFIMYIFMYGKCFTGMK